MKVNNFFIIICLLLSGCNIKENNISSLSVIGRWGLENENKVVDSNYYVKDTLLFLPFNVLLINVDTPDEDYYNLFFKYKIEIGDLIIIKGRFYDELKVEQFSRKLQIQSKRGFITSGTYYRKVVIWDVLLILIPLALLSLVMLNKRKNENK